MSNCPHCQAPIPAPKPGASRPLNFCQACGKSLPVGLGAVKSSPAKTLMWSGGPLPGLPVKPPAPSPEAPPAPAPAPVAAEPAVDAGKRRTATADIGMAPTIVPPAPDSVPASMRPPQKTVIGSGLPAPIPGVVPAPDLAPPSPAEVDVAMDEALAASSQDAEESSAESAAPASPVAAKPEASGPSAADGAVPEWASSAPSVGTATKGAGSPARNKLLIAGVAGGGLLVVAVVAGLLAGGKSPPPKEAAVPKAVPAAEPPKPPAPVAANPAPVAAEPAKTPAAAEAKAEAPAPEKVAAPAEKPAAVAKPIEAAVPAAEKAKLEKKPAPEKLAMAERPAKPAPAPKAAPVPVAERPKAASEPAPVKAEKKLPEAAASASNGARAQLAAEAYQRGNAKLLSGALPEAIAAFSEAIKLNPKDAQSQRGLGLAYAQSGKAPMAVRHLKLYLKAAPGAPDRALIEKRIEQLSGR